MVDPVPALLTVEEAAVILRIGRTKAYAMAREFRDTAGRSGLPVVDLGHVLRVPRVALERLVGAIEPAGAARVADRTGPPAAKDPRTSSHREGQLNLFNESSPAA